MSGLFSGSVPCSVTCIAAPVLTVSVDAVALGARFGVGVVVTGRLSAGAVGAGLTVVGASVGALLVEEGATTLEDGGTTLEDATFGTLSWRKPRTN